tara:strand:- start:630 stop:878 length:249 start_codon:yes stop_codon:yes gene_type:complete
MGEGWLIDRNKQWVFRFHRDEKAWPKDPMVFVDLGRGMPGGQPALLKSREHLRRDAAEQRWMELLRSGWSATTPVWGAATEP